MEEFYRKRSLTIWICLVIVMAGANVSAQTLATLQIFNYNNGAYPGGPLTQGIDGGLYGVTGEGGPATCSVGWPFCGTVFEIGKRGAFKTIYEFCPLGDCAGGDGPNSGLLLTNSGSFIGTSFFGGNAQGCTMGCGTIFGITEKAVLTTLYSFTSSDGHSPTGALVQAPNGTLYGTVWGGTGTSCGGGACGTVYSLSPDGKVATLHAFTFTEGAYPHQLVLGNDGNFYGTGYMGGAAGCPNYGNGCGTVFKITPEGALTVLHVFCETTCTDGSYPSALTLGSDGNFYGGTVSGGDLNCFDGYGCGTLFKITPTGELTTLHNFEEYDGENLYEPPIQGSDGNLYGVTGAGGSGGTIYEITPTGDLTTIYNFCMQRDCPDGLDPNSLMQATDGNFYGTTAEGGDLQCIASNNGCGTAFRLSTGLGPFVAFVRGYGKVGQTGGILGQGFIGTTNVSLNGTSAAFVVISDTLIKATVPPGATTGCVTVSTPGGTLRSNVSFQVIQ